MKNVVSMHGRDPNFPHVVLEKIQEFLGECLPYVVHSQAVLCSGLV